MTQNFEYQKFITKKASEMLTPTGADILGPFYKAKAPFRNTLCEQPSLHLSGRVLDVNGDPVGGVLLDFWQADAAGVYDNDGFNFRGKVITDKDGKYSLHTIIPGDYSISETEFRCSHIHAKVSLKSYKNLTTQLYFADDKYNETDHWFDKSRVINQAGDMGTFDFVIEKK
jgi:protocatechuate 3,4-dioxygenase beta subunit